MTASFTKTITAEEFIAYVREVGSATSQQAAEHFGIRYPCASIRLSRLAAYGRLKVRYVPRRPCGLLAIWSAT